MPATNDEGNGYMQLSLAPRAAPTLHRGGGDAVVFEPRDRCSGVYLSLLLCGAGFLLPYNSFIIAVDYYQDRFEGTRIVFDMSLLYICVAFFGVLTNNLLVEALHLRTRVTFGYVTAVLVLSLVAICDVWLALFPRDLAYSFTLVAVAVSAFAATMQQSSFYGYTSMMPARYTQAVMTGESAAGLLVSINRIITKLFLPDSPRLNTLLFFGVSIGLLLICAIAFHATRNSNFVRYHLNMCKMARLPENERGFSNPCHEELSLVDILDGQGTHAVNPNYGVLRMHSPPSPDASDTNSNHETYTYQREVDDIFGDSTLSPPHKSTTRSFFTTRKTACHKLKDWCKARYAASRSIYAYMLCIASAYLVTLSLFPGIESEVISCRLGSWMPVLLMALFNLTDFCGKVLASIKYAWARGKLLAFTCLRVLLVPLMMLCVMPRASPLLHHEAWPLIVSALLGISNGYFGSVPMILAPGRVQDAHRELTGNLMTLSYSVGLTSGSGIAYALDGLLGPPLQHPCDPRITTTSATTVIHNDNNFTSMAAINTTINDVMVTSQYMDTTISDVMTSHVTEFVNISTTAITLLTSTVLQPPHYEDTTLFDNSTSQLTSVPTEDLYTSHGYTSLNYNTSADTA